MLGFWGAGDDARFGAMGPALALALAKADRTKRQSRLEGFSKAKGGVGGTSRNALTSPECIR